MIPPRLRPRAWGGSPSKTVLAWQVTGGDAYLYRMGKIRVELLSRNDIL